jgi:ribosome-associated toxin RatA of RatAB toxin-antitoxin module
MKIVIALCVLLLGVSVEASMVKEVPKSQREELAGGQTVVKSTDIEGLPWPQLSLYRVVNAPPSVVSALFTDYAAAPTFTPGILSAQVIATNPDGTKDVRYTVKVPILQKISYTVRNTYESSDQCYKVSWKLLQSPLAKQSDGSLRVEPYDGDRTLLCYTNLCVPVTNLVAGLKGQALVEAKNTVLALVTEAERRANQPK